MNRRLKNGKMKKQIPSYWVVRWPPARRARKILLRVDSASLTIHSVMNHHSDCNYIVCYRGRA